MSTSTCHPCNRHCRQGRDCPATMSRRQQPVSLPEGLRQLVERLTNTGQQRSPAG
jgi:hypothetical protein